MKQRFALLTVLLLTLVLAVSATAQISWLKEDGNMIYLDWLNRDGNDASQNKTIYKGDQAQFATGYFGSTHPSKIVHLTVTINNVSDGKIVSTIVSKDVNVADTLGYEVISVLPEHYQNKTGEYIIVIKLQDANSQMVDTLYLKVKSKFITDFPIHIPVDLNDTPEMNNLTNKQVIENSNLQFTVSADDADNDELEYQAQVCIPHFLNEENCSWLSLTWLNLGGNSVSLDKETGVFKFKPSYDFVD